MIEQSIYFALGCIITALLALLFAPVFWSRALRLTRRRLQLQVPLSMQDILAERDQLRAEFAMERLRIEREMERVRATKAKDMASIGRLSVETAAAADETAALHKLQAAQEDEIGLLKRELEKTGAESVALQSALSGAKEQVDRLKQEADEATKAHERLTSEAEVHRETTAAAARSALDEAKARIHSLEENLANARNDVAAVKEREKHLNLQNSFKIEKVRGNERASVGRLEMLQAENAALRGALEAARRDPIADGEAARERDDGSLRSSIHALGLAVAIMTRESREAAERLPRTDAPSVFETNG